MKTSALAIGMVCLALTIGASAASGQALEQGLQWAITPSIWATGLDGTVSLGNVSGDVSDDLGSLEPGGSVRVEAKGPVWTLRAEIGLTSNNPDLSGGGLAGELDTDLFTAELTSGWQFSETAELVFGARYYDASPKLTYPVYPLNMSRAVFESGQTWVDPLVGIWYGGELARYWTYDLRIDAGGFGVGSDLAINARFEFGYQFNDSTSLQFGYRALDVDYEQNSFVYDLLQQGPEVGVRFAF